MRLFPSIEELNIRERIVNFSGIFHLPKLRDLTIGYWIPPKHLRLDLSRLKELRALSLRWSHHIVGLESLSRLNSLHLTNVYGLKHLDFSSLRNLRHLDIGPAKGVRSLSLDGVRRLETLELAVMPRLVEVSGSECYNTVSTLRIPGSHALPKQFFASFTGLKEVTIGIPSSVTPAEFPRCKPKIFKSPI